MFCLGRLSHLPGLEKPLAVLNLELKTSSPLAPERKKKEECFCAWKGWLVPREESCPDISLGRPRVYLRKASVTFLICSTLICLTSSSSSSLLLFCALPRWSQPSWWPCLQPWGTVSLCPCWQQSSWHRRVKLEAAFLFPTSLWSFLAGKPWLLQFPTLQLTHPFPEFPKCSVGSQNTCSVNSDPGGKLAELSFLHWNDDFVFKLQVGRNPSVSPEAPGTLLQELSWMCQLVPWLPERAISQPTFPSCLQEVPMSLPELCSPCWMENSITRLCQLLFLPHPTV